MIATSEIVDFAAARASYFRADFIAWLRDNVHVWQAFSDEANFHYHRGAKRWGARTIGEYLRRETAIRENSDVDYKLNDHRWPDLARLWLLVHPERDGFFLLRSNPDRAAA
jgi:hypothetical protein